MHITDVYWHSHSTSSGQCSVDGLIAWLSADDVNQAVVVEDLRPLALRVVRPQRGRPYVCAWSDDSATDALLALPRF